MTKVKLLSWNATAKEVKLKSGSVVQILKATSSLFARMLVIARSSREDNDLETVIGTHEFAYTNRMLLQPDGSTYPTTDKNTVIHMFESLVKIDGNATPELLCEGEPSCPVVLHELMAAKNLKDCKDLGVSYVKLIDLKA